ncbi:MAG: FkbH-like protein [Pirellulaceae bacterium]|jgi:FkbH-like protein
MYESESNQKVESADQIDPEVLNAFETGHEDIVSRTVLPWGEHCTECAMPNCFKTCSLYSPRDDGKCRRIVNGIVRIEAAGALNGYITKVTFKKWGKLWTKANARLFPIDQAQAFEKRDFGRAKLVNLLPPALGMRGSLQRKVYGWKKKWATTLRPGDELPDYFLLEAYNPQPDAIHLTLTLRSESAGDRDLPFQHLVEVAHGFQRFKIPFSAIANTIDVDEEFDIELTPNDVDGDEVLFFGAADFVKESATRVGKIKCIVWDLDNTLWDGTLVEDGADKLELRHYAVDYIKQLDQRGVLHSIASKNNFDEAMEVLRRYKLEEYFLSPKISWEPKSLSLQQIASDLNIGRDSLLFVDDSPFERAEVETTCPEIRTFDAAHLRDLMQLPEIVAIKPSTDSPRRRETYRNNIVRNDAQVEFSGDYQAFLRHCDIKLSIKPMVEENIERVYELVQRTNQMNFSGNRYERGTLQEILEDANRKVRVLDCSDRFGDYGTVGFCMIDEARRTLIDLVCSCRVQAKRIEHALLTNVLQHYMSESPEDLFVEFRPTDRNKKSAQVFEDFGMEVVEEVDGLRLLVFRPEMNILNDGLIHIDAEELISCQ